MSIHGVIAIRAFGRGSAALLVGAVFYFFARPVGVHGIVVDSFPAFIHVFAMTLLMAAVLRPRDAAPRRSTAGLAAGWVVVNWLFELGQHRDIAPVIAARLDAACGPWRVCATTANYFTYGTFDVLDLLAAALGGLAALCALRRIA
jgi:hypothetical protein